MELGTVLRTFTGGSAIERNILGLLNNIAEVFWLRFSLLVDPWVAGIPECVITRGLCNAVSTCNYPSKKIVASRSFKPFFTLLQLRQEEDVQLWEAKAIHHVCTKTHRRY